MAANIGAVRREVALHSLSAFARLYLAHHFRAPASTMHRELFPLLEETLQHRGSRLAVAAPRGSAKTTVICLAYVLWCLAKEEEPFIILLSATVDQAVGILSDVKSELEDNPLIRSDFPDLAEPQGRRPSPKRWQEKEIVTRTGAMVTALGAGQKIRGRKNREARPSLLILDDIEGEEEAWSADRRRKRWDWLSRAVLKSGATGNTNVLVVGTLVHYDALLARLVGVGSTASSPGWTARRYQSVIQWSEAESMWETFENLYTEKQSDEIFGTGSAAARAFFQKHEMEMLDGVKVLWPEIEDYRALMEMRIVEGRAAFDAEKQNEPIDAENSLFDSEKLTYWDDLYKSEEELLQSLGDDVTIYGAWDPSLGVTGRNGDDSAVVTIAKDGDSGKYYVLDAIIEKYKPSQMIPVIVELSKRRDFRKFVVEGNQFQEVVANQLEDAAKEAGIHLRMEAETNTKNKVARIQGLEALTASGGLVFCRKHRLLMQQLREFPRGAHDDGPDALEMAVRAAREYVGFVIGYA